MMTHEDNGKREVADDVLTTGMGHLLCECQWRSDSDCRGALVGILRWTELLWLGLIPHELLFFAFLDILGVENRKNES